MICSLFTKNTFSFDDKENAAGFLANEIKTSILQSLHKFGEVYLILTGGNTITSFLKHIAALDIPWEKITVLLSDDRIVANESKHSNEGQLNREFFIHKNVHSAKFLSIKNLYKLDTNIINELLYKAAVSSVCILSVGIDGHLASLFPEDKELLKSKNALVAADRKDFKRLSLSLEFFERTNKKFIIIGNKQKLGFLMDLKKNEYPFRKLFEGSHKLVIKE